MSSIIIFVYRNAKFNKLLMKASYYLLKLIVQIINDQR